METDNTQLQNYSDGLLSLAAFIAGNHQRGMPLLQSIYDLDFLEETNPFKRDLNRISRIPNQELRYLFEKFISLTKQMWESEDSLVEIIANFIGAPVPKTPKEKREFQQKIEHYPYQPDDWWLKFPDVQTIIKESAALYSKVEVVKSQIDEKLSNKSAF